MKNHHRRRRRHRRHQHVLHRRKEITGLQFANHRHALPGLVIGIAKGRQPCASGLSREAARLCEEPCAASRPDGHWPLLALILFVFSRLSHDFRRFLLIFSFSYCFLMIVFVILWIFYGFRYCFMILFRCFVAFIADFICFKVIF